MTQPLLIQLWLHTLLPEPAASRFIDSYLTFFSFINFVYVRDGGMNMSQHGYGDQRTVWGGQFFLSTMWSLEIKFKFLGLVVPPLAEFQAS